jgi:hypothetical protein
MSWDQVRITLDLTFGSPGSITRSHRGYAPHTFLDLSHTHTRTCMQTCPHVYTHTTPSIRTEDISHGVVTAWPRGIHKVVLL